MTVNGKNVPVDLAFMAYSFKARGKLNFNANYEEDAEEWCVNNHIPAP